MPCPVVFPPHTRFGALVFSSVNEVICHGIPDARPLEEGDIVNIDISAYYKGFHADLNEMFLVGAPAKVDADSKRLVKTTYDALMAAIDMGTRVLVCSCCVRLRPWVWPSSLVDRVVCAARPGTMVRDFGTVISKIVNKEG